jgi:NAD(P)-dependent dehydrogenase (short-subunit alcohol dehydrogenase family)
MTKGVIASHGGTAFAHKVDLGSVEEIDRFFVALDEQLTARTGSNQLYIIVNNAGVASLASCRERVLLSLITCSR